MPPSSSSDMASRKPLTELHPAQMQTHRTVIRKKQQTYGKRKKTTEEDLTLFWAGEMGGEQPSQQSCSMQILCTDSPSSSSTCRVRPAAIRARTRLRPLGDSAQPPASQPQPTLALAGCSLGQETLWYVRSLQRRLRARRKFRSFEDFASKLGAKFSVEKIAEGTFGDCYRTTRTGPSNTSDQPKNLIFKVMSLKNPFAVGQVSGEVTSDSQFVRETVFLQRLQEIPGFTEFCDAHVVYGNYPELFLDAFNHYRQTSSEAQNPDPVDNAEQLFAILEMNDAGLDLEHTRRPSAFQVFDIFWSVVMSLAKAEQKYEYEHRDLHIGNICTMSWTIGQPAQDVSSAIVSSMTSKPSRRFGWSDTRTTIIDYTLSCGRVDAMGDDNILFEDLRGSGIFNQLGATREHKVQVATYNRMRECARFAHAKALDVPVSSVQDAHINWRRYIPQTNVVWLSYLLQILLMRGRCSIVVGSTEIAKEMQQEVLVDLTSLSRFLRRSKWEEIPGSAGMLLEMGLERGMVGAEDVEEWGRRSDGWS